MSAPAIPPVSSAAGAELLGSLRRISGAAAGLLPHGRRDARGGRRRLAAIHREAERIERLLEDRRDAMRVVRGALKLRPARAEAQSLVLDAVVQLRSAFAARRLSVMVAVQDALPAIRIDRPRILRVLTTLIDNAARRTRRGGEIHIEAAAKDGFVRFSVTGSARAEPGLRAARGIIAAHGGHIGRRRSPRGARVTHIALPIAPALP